MTAPGVYSPEQGAKQRRRHAVVRQMRIVAVMAAMAGIAALWAWVVYTFPTQVVGSIWGAGMLWLAYKMAALYVDKRR